ncbi:MAG: tRNA uridine-5-carboxymethylaminomethyl(34) synthesis enzyme MnmG [Agathobacter sp.]|nr:tRNA uridine-5-carboxymethylaminomethyl(34) synthesis enzyme MnmG [Lachnospiraceae bacterium]MDY2619735.1 tRNA uridine-5-carboxymethylaminomethyl(34) synthesis enzyme MnmG [Agathobacter sp.]
MEDNLQTLENNKKTIPYIQEEYDVVVVGAGHAGCEAALACARLGLETIMFTVSVDSIAMMPCNPNIGGSSKGHLVREVDALGGEMGKNIDKTFIQSKMLNKSKGPAVHSLRAQADKAEYTKEMRKTLQNTDHLTIRQAEVAEILTDMDHFFDEDTNCEQINHGKVDNTSDFEKKVQKITGVRTVSGGTYRCKAVVLCTGTYLRARCLTGEMITHTGPNGLSAANHLTESLLAHGIQTRRFKTGTPARIDKRSIDFSKMEEQFGDERVVPFSFTTNPDDVQIDQVSCWLTYTNEETHKIIRENLDRSPIYAGIIEGTGPRYCPSIEDKVVKFADKDRHQIFVEPEGLSTNEMYIGGMSSSLPEDVQYRMYRTLPGLEHAKIVRNAYAIEYDCIDANSLFASLEFKNIKGLFSGGQFNGSSGYEEAACQGLIAGINAAMEIQGREPLILDRSEAYIGVLIDDLVTKKNREPYRMMTSRAEYRLLLRQDNADLRLTKKGYEVGLISPERYDWVCKKEQLIDEEIERVNHVKIGANAKVQALLEKNNSIPLNTGTTLADLIRRPELDYDKLKDIDADRPDLPEEVTEQVNILIKYEGYITRQVKQVDKFKRLEKKKLPQHFDYNEISGLRIEAQQKLNEFQPLSIGQASRISGVTPADVSVLLVYLEQLKYSNPDLFYQLNSGKTEK